MNRILLTSEGNRQGAVQRLAARGGIEAARRDRPAATLQQNEFKAYALPRDRGGLNAVQQKEAFMTSLVQEQPREGNRRWTTPGGGVETALFVSVQALMLMCMLLVAVELFTTA